MEKSIFVGAKSHETCSKMVFYDVGHVIQPKMNTFHGFQTLECCTETAGCLGCNDQSHGIQRDGSTPAALYDGGGQTKAETSSSPALRGSGKAHILPLFHGLDYKEFVSWLYAIECYFGENGFSEIEKCDMVVSCLRNDALKWYNDVICVNKKSNRTKFKYWHKLRCCLKKKLLPISAMDDLKDELLNLKQDSLCVKDYTLLFEELCFICGDLNDTFEKRSQFYRGLSSEIKDWINIEHISSFRLLYELALISETLIHEHDISMDSLAKDDVIDVGLMNCGNGFDYEVSLTQGVIFGDNGAVLRDVTDQGAVKHRKGNHGTDFADNGGSGFCLVSQEHSYLVLNSWFRWFSIEMELNYEGCNGSKLNKYELCVLSGALRLNEVQNIRFFMLVFDPGGFINCTIHKGCLCIRN